MDARDPLTYVYYFALGLMSFGGLVYCVAPFLPVEEAIYFRFSVIGVGFMLLSFFMLFVILKGDKKIGEATGNKAEFE